MLNKFHAAHQSADRARKQIVLQLGLETLDVDTLRSSTASVCPIDPWHSLCGHNEARGIKGSAPKPAQSSDYIPLGRRCAFDRPPGEVAAT